LIDIPDLGVPEDAGIAKEGEVSHVIGAVKLGRIDLVNISFLEDLYRTSDLDFTLASIFTLKNSLQIPASCLVWHPDRLLGIVGLGFQFCFEIVADLKPRGWVGVWTGGFLDVAGHCEFLIENF